MAKHGIYYDMFEKQQLEAIHGEAGKALIRQDPVSYTHLAVVFNVL